MIIEFRCPLSFNPRSGLVNSHVTDKSKQRDGNDSRELRGELAGIVGQVRAGDEARDTLSGHSQIFFHSDVVPACAVGSIGEEADRQQRPRATQRTQRHRADAVVVAQPAFERDRSEGDQHSADAPATNTAHVGANGASGVETISPPMTPRAAIGMLG